MGRCSESSGDAAAIPPYRRRSRQPVESCASALSKQLRGMAALHVLDPTAKGVLRIWAGIQIHTQTHNPGHETDAQTTHGAMWFAPLLRLPLVVLLLVDPVRSAPSQTEVLALLYRETNGKAWTNNQGWLVGDACDGTWMTTSKYDCYSGELTDQLQPICCELVSLTDTKPRVTKIDLYNNGLEGTIPAEIVELSTLKMLTLDSNRISGTLPPALGELWNLNVLWLHYNRLSGSLPVELGKLTSIVDRGCFLQNNSFSHCASDDEENSPTIPPQCLVDGVPSPTNYLGAASYTCRNTTLDPVAALSDTTAILSREYSGRAPAGVETEAT